MAELDGQSRATASKSTIALAPDYYRSRLAKRSLADIKAGDYVASTSVKGTDGKLHAIESASSPRRCAASAKASSPGIWSPDSVMTNATVSGISAAPQGQMLKVTYKGGEIEVIVGADTPIVTYVPGDPSLLKPGAAVFCIALKKPDGTLTAARITAEKDGVKPPM